MLLGHKISDRVAEMRDLPQGIDQRSASRHPDWTGPDDLEIKLHELREITDWEKPIFVKVGATRTYYDVQLAVKAGADVIVVDGMQGGTAATQDVFIEHVGIPTLPAVKLAVDALQELGMHRQVQLVVSGGIRTGADVAKALALGADAVSIGVAALIALGDNAPELEDEYRQIGSAAGFYDDWQAGRDPAGHLDAGRRARRAVRPRPRRPPARELPPRPDPRDADARPRVREVARPQHGARGPRRADDRGVADDGRPARGDAALARRRDRRAGRGPPRRTDSTPSGHVPASGPTYRRGMRPLAVLAVLAVVVTRLFAVVGTATAASSPGSGSPSCLRGNWVATQGETRRVMRALVPGGLFTSYGRLYMTFRGGAFQYGSTGLVLETNLGDATMTARARFFTLAPYTARAGLLTIAGGRVDDRVRADERDEGRTHVHRPGPADADDLDPGGSTPFQCRGSTLRVRLPRVAALDWITLRRGAV